MRDLEYYSEKIDKKDGPANGFLSFIEKDRIGDKEKAYIFCKNPICSTVAHLRSKFSNQQIVIIHISPWGQSDASGHYLVVLEAWKQNGPWIEIIIKSLPKQWKSLKIIGLGSR
jgi:hypothetical protein